jgi:hypothetical protein
MLERDKGRMLVEFSGAVVCECHKGLIWVVSVASWVVMIYGSLLYTRILRELQAQ